MIHFLKFNFIGLLNTLLGLGVIWVALVLWQLHPVVANLLGYVIGGVHSYFWHRLWNFRSKQKPGSEIMRFILAFGLGYGANLMALFALQYLVQNWPPMIVLAQATASLGGGPYLAQVGAFICYLLISYTLLRWWVFAPVFRLEKIGK